MLRLSYFLYSIYISIFYIFVSSLNLICIAFLKKENISPSPPLSDATQRQHTAHRIHHQQPKRGPQIAVDRGIVVVAHGTITPTTPTHRGVIRHQRAPKIQQPHVPRRFNTYVGFSALLVKQGTRRGGVEQKTLFLKMPNGQGFKRKRERRHAGDPRHHHGHVHVAHQCPGKHQHQQDDQHREEIGHHRVARARGDGGGDGGTGHGLQHCWS